MADFASFSTPPITTLQTSDLFLGLRGAGGINFTLGALFNNVPGSVLTGLGVSTGAAAIEVGQLRTGDGVAYVDLHAVSGGDYAARLLRSSGVNGACELINTGTGNLTVKQLGAGSIVFYTANSARLHVLPDGNMLTVSALRHVFGGYTDASNHGPFIAYNSGSSTLDIVSGFDNANGMGTGGIRFGVTGTGSWTGRLRLETSGTLRPENDNVYTLGAASYRWSVVYAGTGTINTSDEREKLWRGAMNDAELRAARRMIDELGFFQWRQAVEEKGEDGARMHFGPRAQRVWAIMADEGLVDPIGKDGRPGKTPYAFLCFDEWADEYEDEMKPVIRRKKVPAEEASVILDPRGGRVKKTKMVTAEVEEMAPTGRKLLVKAAGNRFGLRVDQLTLFLIAAQAARQSDIEARSIEQESAIAALRDRLAALEAA